MPSLLHRLCTIFVQEPPCETYRLRSERVNRASIGSCCLLRHAGRSKEYANCDLGCRGGVPQRHGVPLMSGEFPERDSLLRPPAD